MPEMGPNPIYNQFKKSERELKDVSVWDRTSNSSNDNLARPGGCKKAKHDATIDTMDAAAIQKLALTKEKKSLCQDHMLMELLMRSSSPQNEALLQKLTAKYVAEVFTEHPEF